LEKGGNNKAKRKAFRQNIKKGYQKPLGHPLTLGTHLHAKHLQLKPLAKKNEMKEVKPKGTPRIMMPSRGELVGRINPRSKLDEAQAEHLHG
jgi:hypothetical protein